MQVQQQMQLAPASIYGELRNNAPDYQSMTKTAEQARMNERISAMNAEANMAAAGIQAKSASLKLKNKPRHMKLKHPQLRKVE